MGATPALANASAASADLVAPVRDAKAAGVSGGDEQFKQLFSSWRSMDQSPTVSTPVAPSMGVSIPSRAPLAVGSTSSGYGMRTHPVIGGKRAHKGIDLAAPTGTPIYATADGVIGKADWFSSYGLFVSIAHGGDIETRYAHMSRVAVAAGDRVRKGDVIGYVGSTGRSTGPHLHYEVRVAGEAVNPIPYMAETGGGSSSGLALAAK
ncbi:peptidoglycan DD-metalloendopeptidase family protein [Altererythrobacter aerius]|uniref:Peptidoglycan DD-metalloendopeptidase family protein n=1 Tax=Tsuneonella aeria TaxID=1837929 RepID=A0A6I4TFT2_9SPHN|nr:M23 family metallopeptidase [Tsuneonella aeria]MXO75534.1 peptidoglycan DD-metalloendopeptidase family protein [Tsuneonella aeria]